MVGPGAASNHPAEAERLLVSNPALPASWEVLAGSSGEQPEKQAIAWEMTVDSADSPRSDQCDPNGLERVRIWNDQGERWREPEVLQFVCTYSSPEEARTSYSSVSAFEAAGENYPNFDGQTPEAGLRPSRWDPRSVKAQDAEVMCAAGSPSGLCSVWMYRGLYDRHIVRLLFRSSSGGIRSDDFLQLVQDVDEKVNEASP